MGGPGNVSHDPRVASECLLEIAMSFALLGITSYGSGLSVWDYAGLIGASLVVTVLALGGRRAGLRAPLVIRRNLGLARFGRVVATLALEMSIAAGLVGTIHLVGQL